MGTRLHQLADRGQSVWVDSLSRDLLRGGDLARMVREDARHRRHLEPDAIVSVPGGHRTGA